MNGPVHVSVVMGVYNGERELPATLDSIFSQQGVEFECIVVDDGSTDATWSILQQRAANDPRLHILQQERGGLTRALANGCAHAQGEFIARQDVGDLSLPHRLSRQYKLLASKPELAFVACRFVPIGPLGEALGNPQPADGGGAITDSLMNALVVMKCPHHGSVMFRRAAYEGVGGYRPEFYFAQDLDLWARLIEVGGLAFVDEVLYRAAFAPGSISGRHQAQQAVLHDLIREATLRRRSGVAEDQVLQRAAQILPEPESDLRRVDARTEYFIGSCLFARGDPTAIEYLRRAIVGDRKHFKAWLKLLVCLVRNR